MMINYAVQRDSMRPYDKCMQYVMVDILGGATVTPIPHIDMTLTVASPSMLYCVHMVFRTEIWRSSLN